MSRLAPLLLLTVPLSFCACQLHVIDETDRGVYRLIEDRQKEALGRTSDISLGPETGEVATTDRMYSFNPQLVDPGVPEAFQMRQRPAQAADPEFTEESIEEEEEEEEDGADDAEMHPSIFSPEEEADVQVFTLRDALAYAARHGRELQDAKEDLYVQALELSLERHLWTPQFVASATADGEWNDGDGLLDNERTLTAVSQVGLTQRLPYGGQVTARILANFVRDLEEHVTAAESGQMILEANIPLLRGAGRVAYESRYSAERQMIYAARAYERFRRSFLVDAASRYFDLQQTKAIVYNAYQSYQSRKRDWEKADFINRMGRSKNVFDASRAQSSLRDAESSLVSAKEQFETALDRYKIFIGMPVDTLLDVVNQEDDDYSKTLDDLLPNIDVSISIETALRFRLDLLTDTDRVDDARRGVVIAKNRILPDLDVSGGVILDTDPDHLNSFDYNLERATYRGGVSLRIDDRKSERNDYRAALIGLRRSQRDYEESVDVVRAEVRRALRSIQQQVDLRAIQELNVKENELRLEAARAQFDLGKITNRDVVEAEDDLFQARNRLARAVADYRIAVLEFRLETGTLRVTDDGGWDFAATAPLSDQAGP